MRVKNITLASPGYISHYGYDLIAQGLQVFLIGCSWDVI